MEDFADLMQRLLEIQSVGSQRSPELVAEEEEERQKPKPSSGDCVNRLAQGSLFQSRITGRQSDGSTG